jgi:cell division protein FtsL
VSAKAKGAVAAIAVPAMLLVLSSLSLVTAQHRARGLFVDLGRSQNQTRDLETEGNRLRIELGKASQPAAVAAGARALGLRPTEAKQTVFLPALVPAEVAAAGNEDRR